MKKKLLSILTAGVLSIGILAGCGSSDGNSSQALKVGMVTNSGSIDDKSFNQGTWEGLQMAEKDLGVKTQYLKPAGTTEGEYKKEIGNLYDAGVRLIVTPGFKFETAVYNTQDKYSDSKFVLIDGTPNDGSDDPVSKVAENTVSIYFAEHEAGFVAGVAAAVELKDGELGFIGGMEIPSVQRFNYGFQQGVAYANENLGTNMSLKAENIVYQGTFDNSSAGTQIAATMYDRGVKAIFCAAGDVGNGVITEAKTRVNSGSEAWVIGVDSDQYDDGIYADGKSVVLTSAIKRVDTATYDMVKAYVDGAFPGGETLNFDVKNDGVGIPEANPNLSDDTMKSVNDIYSKIKSGEITVSSEKGDLI